MWMCHVTHHSSTQAKNEQPLTYSPRDLRCWRRRVCCAVRHIEVERKASIEPFSISTACPSKLLAFNTSMRRQLDTRLLQDFEAESFECVKNWHRQPLIDQKLHITLCRTEKKPVDWCSAPTHSTPQLPHRYHRHDHAAISTAKANIIYIADKVPFHERHAMIWLFIISF